MRALGVVAFLLIAGCVDSNAVECAGGRICPTGQVCDDQHGQCVEAEQLETCRGSADDTDCMIDGAAAGICKDEVCLAASCGDGFVRGAEQCDPGAPLAESADDCTEHDYHGGGKVTCRNDCTFDLSACSGICGDGVVDGDEVCDGAALGSRDCTAFGFYNAAGLTCSLACTYDISQCTGSCGDGVLDAQEECEPQPLALGGQTCTDLGYYQPSGLGCTSRCTFDDAQCLGFCGDRAVNGGELCDGKAPATRESCTAFGFEGGPVTCQALCGADFASCHAGGWQAANAGFTQAVQALLVLAPDDVYAAGSNGIRHFDGVTWTAQVTTTAVNGLWASTAGDIWAVGETGALLHRTGGAWQPVASGTTQALRGVWGASATDIYVAGDQLVLHYDGTVWAKIDFVGSSFRSVWGSGPNNVYAVGDSSASRRWDGSTWQYSAPPVSGTFWDVWGTAADDMYIVGSGSGGGLISHWNGTAWSTTQPGPAQIYSVWGSGTQDVYAGAAAGQLLHFDGGSWTAQATSSTANLYAVDGSSAADVYIAGQQPNQLADTVRHYDGNAWKTVWPWSSGVAQSVTSFWPLDATITYAVTSSGSVLRWDGTSWAHADGGVLTGSNLTGVWARNDNDIYVVGPTGIAWHYNGLTWSNLLLGSFPFQVVWGSGANVFIARTDGVVMRYDGLTWTSDTVTILPWYGIWGSSPTNVYVVGLSGTYRWNGAAWAQVLVGSATAVWGSGPDDIYVVRSGNPSAHWNGTAWSNLDIGVVTAITGNGPSDVTAFLDSAAVHFDGYSWTSQAQPAFTRVATAGGGSQMFAAGRQPDTLLWRARDCAVTETACGDSRDDDCDGAYDCADADCASDASCMAGGTCDQAIAISCGVSASGTTTAALSRMDRYACDASLELGREETYRLSGATGPVTVTLSSPGKDLDLVVLGESSTGGCDPRATGCIGASSTNADESVMFTAAAGKDYYLVVDGFGSESGSYTLDVSCP